MLAQHGTTPKTVDFNRYGAKFGGRIQPVVTKRLRAGPAAVLAAGRLNVMVGGKNQEAKEQRRHGGLVKTTDVKRARVAITT